MLAPDHAQLQHGSVLQPLLALVLVFAGTILLTASRILNRIRKRQPMLNDPLVFQPGGFVMDREGNVTSSIRLTEEAMRPQRTDF